MKITTSTILAGIAMAATLAFVGCATGPASDSAEGMSSVDACQQLNSELRGINNAALNTLAGDIATDPTGVEAVFDGLIKRADALSSEGADAAASMSLSDALTSARQYVATAPVTTPDSDEEAADAKVRVGISGTIESASMTAKESCESK